MNRPIRPIACILCLLLCGTPLHAQTPPPDPAPSALLTDPQAQAHRDAATALAAKYDYTGAIQEYQQAYLLDKVSHLQNAGTDLNDIGTVYNNLSQYSAAIDFFQQALAIEREVKNKNGEATLLNNLGSAYDSLSQYDKAIDFYQQALTIHSETRDRPGEAATLNNLGASYDNLSQYDKGIDFFQQALFICREINSTAGKAAALSNLGYAYAHLSQYDNAIDFFQQALTLEREVKNRPEEAGIINNIGDAYINLSRYDKAIGFFQKALSIQREVKNRNGESITLNNLGSAYIHLGRYDKGIYFFQQALAVRREIKDRAGEATALNNLGAAYENLSRYDKATGFYQQALTIQREIKDQDGEANTLNNLGSAYDSLSRYDKAIDFFRQALLIEREVKDRSQETSTLNNLGGAYGHLSRYDKATDFYQQALLICREIKDQAGVGAILSNLGDVSNSLSQYDKAIDFYQQALPIEREVKDRAREAITLTNIGATYENLGKHDKAIDFNQQALIIEREVKDKAREATTLNNIGGSFDSLNQHDKAIDFYRQALTIQREVKDRQGEALTLNNLGYAYYQLRQFNKGIGLYQQALLIERDVKYRAGEATTLGNLMSSWQSHAESGLATFYGKQAVNAIQSIRRGLGALDKQSQKSYLAANADTYRTLAALLISQGRLPEAQQVLGLLKEEELFTFLRGGETTGTAGQADLTPQEAVQERAYALIAGQVIALGQQQQTLRDRAKQGALTPDDQTQSDAVRAKLTTATHHLKVFYAQLAAAFSAPAKDNPALQARLQAVKGAADLQSTLEDLHTQGQNVIVLQTLVAPDRYVVIVTTAQSQKVEQFPIKTEGLNQKVADFQAALRNPAVDPRPAAHALYEILIAPLEKDLTQAGAKTLMWSLDGTLRYVPIAALYDGKHYLVERFDNEVFTLGSQTGFGQDARKAWTGLGLGVSLAHTDFIPLPAVPDELRGVIQGEGAPAGSGAVPGTVLLDPAFTQVSMTHALEQGKYNLVHIASHFALHPGDPDGSFLLLGDGGHLSLAQMADDHSFFHGVDLLSLSACDTATGGAGADGKEVDSLGTIAQQDGAKSVLASLWPVADASTRELMQTFYRWHETHAGVSKAAALQAAQLSLLHGQGASSGTATRGTENVSERSADKTLPPFAPDPKAPYAHPFYWAPFILIGNWR